MEKKKYQQPKRFFFFNKKKRRREAAVSSRWMAVIQKYGKNFGPDLVSHKENQDKIGAPGSNKKWSEHNSNWSR